MTQPQITPAGDDQPMSEADRPPCRGEVASLAQEIAEIGGGLPKLMNPPAAVLATSQGSTDR